MSDSKPVGKLYKTTKPLMQFHFGDQLVRFINSRLRAVDQDLIDFLDKEIKLGNKSFKVADNQNEEEPKEFGSDLELRAKQIADFRASQAASVVIPDTKDPGKLNPASTADSPLTGGMNPVAPRFTQAQTAEALKNKLLNIKDTQAVGNQLDLAAKSETQPEVKTEIK